MSSEHEPRKQVEEDVHLADVGEDLEPTDEESAGVRGGDATMTNLAQMRQEIRKAVAQNLRSGAAS